MATGTREDVVDLLLKQHDEIRSLLDTVERSSGERRKQKFDELRRKGKEHQIEQVGAELRAMMPWISAGKAKVEDISGGD